MTAFYIQDGSNGNGGVDEQQRSSEREREIESREENVTDIFTATPPHTQAHEVTWNCTLRARCSIRNEWTRVYIQRLQFRECAR